MQRFGQVKELVGQAGQAYTKVKQGYNQGWDHYPNGKAEEIAMGCAGEVPPDAPYYKRLRHDLVFSYYFSGHIVTDFIFFVANWHPLLSILLCHPNHPYTKWDRVMALVITLAMSIVPSACIASSVSNLAMVKTLTILWVTLPATAISLFLSQLSFMGARCPSCANCCIMIQTSCTFFALAIAAISSAIGYLIMTGENKTPDWHAMLHPIIVGQIQSWILWFPINYIMPCQVGFHSLWFAESRAVENGQNPEDVHIGQAPEA
mmetsp:Transcript_52709/g.112747  ORF Transcript_52709/g.112747 Transcript_52709/m.112747 type:complete len:262 (-) Transcript_52709:58-843(-)